MLRVTRGDCRAAAALVLLLGLGCGRTGGCESRAQRPERRGDGAPRVGAPAPEPARELSGTVVRVRDGDSLVVLAAGEAVEVRLDGVDAPELAQAFGRRSRRHAAGLAFGSAVRLEVRGRDAYGRMLAEVFLPDGRSLNRELVSAGLAWWFRRHSRDADLESLERQARAARLGLWADPDPVPPWEFREANPRPRRAPR